MGYDKKYNFKKSICIKFFKTGKTGHQIMIKTFFRIALRVIIDLLLLVACINFVTAQILPFRAINSGTRADIRNIRIDRDQNVYFLTDKIYQLNDSVFEKMDFPAEGKIFKFFPVSAQDIWFTINQVNYTCMLYHFKDGKTENVHPPFSNHISAIRFFSADSALFASFAELAFYPDGNFSEPVPVPVRYVIEKIVRQGPSFYFRTNAGEMILLKEGQFRPVSPDEQVTDFCFDGQGRGYLVTGNKLKQFNDIELSTILTDSLLKNVTRIEPLPDGSLIMGGRKGLIIRYNDNKIEKIETGKSENLNDIAVGTGGEIWICGDNGRILYFGERKFPEFTGNIQGFSSYKLIKYGVSTDDEYGIALADFNRDQWTDIYAVRIYEQNRLYINNIGKDPQKPVFEGFSEEVARRNAHGVVNPEKSDAYGDLKLGVVVADVDNDDDQDLYLCYLNTNNKLLLNTGKGYFRNVSEQKNRACLNMNRSNSAAFADIDLDGDLDLFVANEEGTNRLFENNGTGTFTDITEGSGLETDGGGMCASFADLNRDGFPDLCVTFWNTTAKLYFNGSGKGQKMFTDVSRFSDISKAPESKNNGVAFADINNDGSDDLLIASRDHGCRFYLNDGSGNFNDRTETCFKPMKRMANGLVLADFDLDGFQDLYLTCVGENILYQNIEGKYFTDVTAIYGAELSGYGTGCATSDIDNDGDPDLYAANYVDGNSLLFLNNTGNKHFVKIKLHGVKSNKDAIGTKVWLYEESGGGRGKMAGYRELRAGEGYGSVNNKEMIFGVKPGINYTALVKFPCTQDTLRKDGILAGNFYEINETEGFEAIRISAISAVSRFFKDKEFQPEIFKYFIIIILLVIYNFSQKHRSGHINLVNLTASAVIFMVFIFINSIFLYQGLNMAFFTGPLVFAGLLALFHLIYGRMLYRTQVRREKLELREKLSRDLHDDLASTLGSISIYAGTLNRMNEMPSPETKKLSQKISSLTQSALQSISEIIWMTSPRNDTLQSLISKTSNYMLELLTDNKIGFVPDIDIPDQPVVLSEKVRNDTFLILKEALNNAIRHSGADTIFFSAKVRQKVCTISLKDNGHGFLNDSMKDLHGNGLLNMKKRAEESGISFSLHSSPLTLHSSPLTLHSSPLTLHDHQASGVEIILEFKI